MSAEPTRKRPPHSASSEGTIPVTTVWEGVLLLPLAGILDSNRAQLVMDAMLTEINATEAQIFILDILGVEAVDTAVANHLIKMTQASDLLGCKCVISGISPAVAQALVQLGIPLSEVVTRASIRDALQFAFDRLGVEVTETPRRGAAHSG